MQCQRWDAQTPHGHDYTDPRYFPDATVEEAGNYCRRMDERWPWCYTMSGTRWEWCGKLDLLCTICKYLQPFKCCKFTMIRDDIGTHIQNNVSLQIKFKQPQQVPKAND